MGRGAAWTDIECAHLAEAWLIISQDPVVGTDQSCFMFYKKVFDLFKSRKPPTATEKQYDARGVKASRAKWEAISADVQKFRAARRELRLFNPTGTNEQQNLSMTIARHLNKMGCITYQAKNFPHEEWVHHLAFNVVKNLPKFRDDVDENSSTHNSSMSEEATANGMESPQSEETDGVVNNDLSESERDVENVSTQSPSPSKKREKVVPEFSGRKKAKNEMVRNRQNEAAIRNAASIAASMKRRTELLEEQNALIAFSASECLTQQARDERDEFMNLTRRIHLKRLRESFAAAEQQTPTQQSTNTLEIQALPQPSTVPDIEAAPAHVPPIILSPPLPPSIPPLPDPPRPPSLPASPERLD